MADNNVANYTEQGGDKTVIGGVIDITGSALLASVTLTATAAEINALHSQGAVAADYAKLHAITVTAAQVNRTGVTTAGVVEASKVLVVDANKKLDHLDLTEIMYNGVTLTVTAASLNKAVASTTAGAVITGGEVSISGSTSFATGLATVVAVTASQVGDASLTDSMWATASKGTTAGWVIVKSWKPTATNDATPIAGSASTTFSWSAIGT
jgi:hypothetical protein